MFIYEARHPRDQEPVVPRVVLDVLSDLSQRTEEASGTPLPRDLHECKRLLENVLTNLYKMVSRQGGGVWGPGVPGEGGTVGILRQKFWPTTRDAIFFCSHKIVGQSGTVTISLPQDAMACCKAGAMHLMHCIPVLISRLKGWFNLWKHQFLRTTPPPPPVPLSVGISVPEGGRPNQAIA